jgi:hypothetical protein
VRAQGETEESAYVKARGEGGQNLGFIGVAPIAESVPGTYTERTSRAYRKEVHMRLNSSVVAAILSLCVGAFAADAGVSKKYKAVKFVAPAATTVAWAVMDRDGANRQVTPYLSSLAAGEGATGVIASPTFKVATDKISFTLCGHDGQGGGQQKNFIALVDAKTGDVIVKTCAPGSDEMQPGSWDTAALKGREMRIEVRDGVAVAAYAWLGVGTLDAGPALKVDFGKGLPAGWKASAPPPEKVADKDTAIVAGPVPFRATRNYTMVPPGGAIEFPVGVVADRLFFLGCTVARGKPLELCGRVEIVYRDGATDTVPLLNGFTIDGENKVASPCAASVLRPSADPFQYYFVVAPRAGVIEKLRLLRETGRGETPRITAVTIETGQTSASLEALPEVAPSAADAAWIKDHAVRADALKYDAIVNEIARAHKL